MKKNRMMRAASALLVAVLLTTCTISGTFAKYVTSDDASDEARVAKWGVTVIADGTLFAKNYINAAGGNTPADAGELTVQSSDTNDVVAPGTSNTSGMSFTITGTSEVDLSLVINATVQDIVLPEGTYVDYTDGDAWTAADAEKPKFTLLEDYHPVKFTLTNGKGEKVVDGQTLADVETYLEALDTNATIQAGTKLDTLGANTNGQYTLTWEWPINGNDAADTYLGNVIAGTVTNAAAQTNISFAVSITATQVD